MFVCLFLSFQSFSPISTKLSILTWQLRHAEAYPVFFPNRFFLSSLAVSPPDCRHLLLHTPFALLQSENIFQNISYAYLTKYLYWERKAKKKKKKFNCFYSCFHQNNGLFERSVTSSHISLPLPRVRHFHNQLFCLPPIPRHYRSSLGWVGMGNCRKEIRCLLIKQCHQKT